MNRLTFVAMSYPVLFHMIAREGFACALARTHTEIVLPPARN